MEVFDPTRIFWIYLIITLFFVIIGLFSMLSSNLPITIITIWFFSTIISMMLIYRSPLSKISTSIFFIILIVLSTFWAIESTTGVWRAMSSIIILMCAIYICALSLNDVVSYWLCLIYCILWLILTFYSTLNT